MTQRAPLLTVPVVPSSRDEVCHLREKKSMSEFRLPASTRRPIQSAGLALNEAMILERKHALADDLIHWQRKHDRSREEFVSRLSEKSGRNVSAATLENWLAPSKLDRRMPVEFEFAWHEVTGSMRILNLKAQQIGARVVRSSDLPERYADALKQRRRWQLIEEDLLREMMSETAA